ncbi:MAG: histidinol-phosphate transaminase [bacterium]|nr:histidinol-phosphate transaminase [bacterium]
MSFDLESLIRENIRRLKPYSSARSEFAGEAEVFLDANENAFGSPAGVGYNRYPDPLQKELKGRVAELCGVDPSQIFVGNGSDEAIDLLFRIFCEPGRDDCIVCPPTYGMYCVSADINDVVVSEFPLSSEFQLDVPAILSGVTPATKLIFICSPNNPTGNLMERRDVISMAEKFRGIVVIDEAYIHFAASESFITELTQLPNVVVLQTFSKAWGMAGLRVGLAFASAEIIALMNRVKPPYNVSAIAQRAVLEAIERRGEIQRWISETINERNRLIAALKRFDFVETIYPSDANFVLVRVSDAHALYRYLVMEKIVVRDRSNVEHCEGCVRITIGTVEENNRLISALERFIQGRDI